MSELRIAVIFINFGPYHVARAQALSDMAGVSPYFIELARSVKTHPWEIPDRQLIPLRLHTLVERAWEETGYSQLTRELWKALDKYDPAIVFTSSYRPFVMLSAARWAKSRRRCAAMFFDSTPWDRRRYLPIETAKRAVIKRYYNAALVGGRTHEKYLARLGFPSVRIWHPYNVVDNDRFAAREALIRGAAEHWRRAFALPEHFFLYVGRYAPEKNLRRLLMSYREYRIAAARTDPWSLVLVGDGPERAELKQFVDDSRLEGIMFRPFAQIDELAVYYSLAECLVLPSISEPWGLVVNEAMACGLPVVLSKRCGCAPELVQEGYNGFCFDPYDLAATTNALVEVSELEADARRLLGERSRVTVSRFTPQKWAEAVVDCARTVVADRAS